MRKLLSLSVLTLWMFSAVSGSAQQRFPADSCEPVIAVHNDACEIDRVFRCRTENGIMMEHQSVEPGDFDFIDHYDEDYALVRAFQDQSEVVIPKILEVFDRLSLKALITTGSEREHYIALFKMPIAVEPFKADATAFYTLSGESIEIDGEILLAGTAAASVELIGTAFKLNMEMEIFVDPIRNVLIDGKGRIEIGGAYSTQGGNPVSLIKPDNPLFKSNTPLYGCGELSLRSQTGMRAKG